MILSASRRTDIPAHYAPWFMARVRAGFALTRNPMNHRQLYRVPLTPEEVECAVFWTKDPLPLMPHLDELDARGWRYYFQFTLTPYGRALEPGLRDKTEIGDTLEALGRRNGRARVVWRYDPIILNDELTVAWHRAQFARLCGRLAAFTDTVTVSFVDLYPKLKTPLLRAITPDEMAELAGSLSETARAHGLTPVACSEQADLTPYGIGQACCIDRRRLEQVCGQPLRIGPDRNQRGSCGCCESVDIGAYDTCVNGCVYCYANRGDGAARRRHDAHDPQSPLLTGAVGPDEVIVDRVVPKHRI